MSRVRGALRRAVAKRARRSCEYCGAPERASPVAFHCEHVIPLQHAGRTELENLALACPACNFRKGTNLTALDPETGTLCILFHPRRDEWAGHFELRDNFIVAKTDSGRATARLLEFNAPHRVASRAIEQRLSGS